VEGYLYVGDSLNYAAGNTEYHGDQYTIQRSNGGGVGGVSRDTSGTNTDGGTQHDEVDPFRNLPVRHHQADVDILGVGGD